MSYRTRPHEIKIRLNDFELALLKARLKSSQQSMREYITTNAILDNQLESIIELRCSIDLFARALMLLGNEVNRIGNNVNQIAHRHNASDYVDNNLAKDTITTVREAQQILIQTRAEIIELWPPLQQLLELAQPNLRGNFGKRGGNQNGNNQSD